MMSATRGAARVSVVWFISILVLFLVALAFGYISQDEAAMARQAELAAQNSEAEADRLFEEEAAYARELSRVVGWYDREGGAPRSNPELITAALSDLRSTFTEIDASVADLERALPHTVRMYNARVSELNQIRARVTQLESELATERQGRQADVRAKDQQIATLRSQLADQERSAADREADLSRRLATANTQISSLDADARRLRQEIESLRRGHGQELATYRSRVDEMGRKLTFLQPDRRDEPDGRVLAVSALTGSAWIDIGANQRVARGMRFRVESAGDLNRRVKAMAEVVEVEAARARVVLLDQADTFDPVQTGDVVINPVFDPTGERRALLVGRFSGAYGEKELRALLSRLGISVQERLDLTTDFLIVGGEIFVDEFGEPLEEPLQPSDLPAYREAEALGVQIVPIQRIREYFVL
jgi:hypothetical protein